MHSWMLRLVQARFCHSFPVFAHRSPRLSSLSPTLRQHLPQHQRRTLSVPATMATQWSYDEAIERLNSFQTNASVLKQQRQRGIDMTQSIPMARDFLRRINVTQDDLRRLNIIHIAGSKGKGSVAAFTESILRAQGFKTGIFTSPHLIEARERIRINGAPISQEAFARHMQHMVDLLDASPPLEGLAPYPTYFKATFLLALKVFLAENVDVAVLEVGLGGLYDATNVVDHPVVCGITHIGYEHTSILGDTLTKIAHQKCGILKPHVPAFVTPQESETLAEFHRSKELRKPLGMHLVPGLPPASVDVQLGLSGDYQRLNAALAVQLARTWQTFVSQHQYPEPSECEDPTQDILPETKLEPLTATEQEALRTCRWPGRAQIMEHRGVTFFLDGAHTVESCKAMVGWLRTVVRPRRSAIRVLIFNCTGDRKPESLLRPILEMEEFDLGIFCPNVASLKKAKADQINHNASATACHRLQRQCRDAYAAACGGNDAETKMFPCIEDAVAHIVQLREESDKPVEVLVTGSLHLVGGTLGVLGAPVS